MLLGEKEVDGGLIAEALVEDEVPRIVPVLVTGRLSFPSGVKSTSPGSGARLRASTATYSAKVPPRYELSLIHI